jgi:GT2 family glycosyltransferase
VPSPSAVPATRVVAVVVTWNRRELLTESLNALRAQTHRPVAIVVIDNASTDGTNDLLASAFADDLDVVTLRENTGGAGGFTVGVERALGHHPDLVWLLDDDTVPTPSAAAELVESWETYPGTHPAVLASRVVWTDGRDHPMNTPRMKPGATADERAAAATVGAFPIRSASFVSIMCDAARIRERGLPVADFFLWNDDFEYSTRLIRDGVGLSCPSSVVVHKTKVFGSTDVDPGERFFYEVRNKLWVFSRSRGLSLPERGLYSAATARRWVRTFGASTDRATLRRAMGRGLVAGLRRPRPSDGTPGGDGGR